MPVRLRSALLFVRSVPRAIPIYRDGVGLKLTNETDRFARLVTDNGFNIDLVHAHTEAQASTAYSPFLTFLTHDMDATIPQLISHGAVLDGPIQYMLYGKVAALRSPDGHMLGFYEHPENTTDRQVTDCATAEAARKRAA